MAKNPTSQKEQNFEEVLWNTANKLRGSVESSEYKHVVLSLIFLKFASDKFEERRQELIDEGKHDYLDMVEFYTMKNVFFLPAESRWSYIKQHSKQGDIAIKIDTALFTVEKNNKALKGALPDNYFSRLGLDTSKLASLIDAINKINTVADKEEDVVGRVYEYFLGKFAASEGKKGGEFYTPSCIVKLIAEMIEPFKGKIYDPCCGSGGMFVQSMKFVTNHHGNRKNIAVYGQEYTSTTYKLAKMNLAIRSIAANLGAMVDRVHKELSPDDIAEIAKTYHAWRGEAKDGDYEDKPGYCKSSTLEEIKSHHYVLTPGRYVGAAPIEDDLPAPRPSVFYVYVIKCANDSYYIGQTDDLRRRWEEHLTGRGADWTKKFKPIYIAHHEELSSREAAVIREKELKTTSGRRWIKQAIKDGRARQAGGIPFEEKMTELSTTLYKQMHESVKLDEIIRKNLEHLGFG